MKDRKKKRSFEWRKIALGTQAERAKTIKKKEINKEMTDENAGGGVQHDSVGGL